MNSNPNANQRQWQGVYSFKVFKEYGTVTMKCIPLKCVTKSMGYLLKTLACKESKMNCLWTTEN